MFKMYLALFIGIICVSLASILIKLTNDVPSVIMTSYRLAISSLILIIYSLIKYGKIELYSRKDMLIAALSGLFLSAHFIFWIASIKYTSIPSSVTLVATSPIFVAFFSFFVLKETQNRAIIVSIFLSFIGLFILTSSDGGLVFDKIDKISLMGDVLAIFGAVAVSGYFIVGSYLRRNMNIVQYITLVYSFAAIFSLIFAYFSNEKFTGYKESSYIYMFLLAVVPQLIGHTSFNWALKYAKTSAVAIATLGEPIGATILSYIIFNQGVSLIQGLGMAIVLSSIFIASKYAKK
jgi:drug/metabolite transporter (DMT)-like permease